MKTTSRSPETTGLSQRLAAMVGAASAELRIGDEPDANARRLLALSEEPVELFERHPVWPSRMTGTGQPVELSLKIEPGDPSLRWVVDVTDHRLDQAANRARYLSYASRATQGTGAETAELRRLCELHLSEVPARADTRMMHGSSLARLGRSRGSLYFNTAWLSAQELVRRFPRESGVLAEVGRRHGSPVSREVEVIGYDFVAGAPRRAKAYVLPRAAAADCFEELAGRHPDLAPARVLFEAFGGMATARRHPHPHLLQISVDEDAVRQRLFFFSSAWGWGTRAGLDALLDVLSARLAVDLEPLLALEAVAVAHRVPICVALVAIGASASGASVTFYLWPLPGEGDGGFAPLPSRKPAGARVRDAEAALGAAARHLTGRAGGSGSLGSVGADPEIAVLAVAALAGREAGVSEGADGALEAGAAQVPEEVAVEATAELLLATLRTADGSFGLVVEAVFSLAGAQTPEGAWRSSRCGDDLFATWRALCALRAYQDHEIARCSLARSSSVAAGNAIVRAMGFLGSVPVAGEPLSLGLWLGCWLSAGGGTDEPRVTRVLDALLANQEPGGGWRPDARRAPTPPGSGEPPLDGGPVVATATVAGALDALLSRLADGEGR